MKNLLIAGLLLAVSGAATGADAFTACTADAATCMASLGNLGLPLTSLMTDCTSQPATLSASVTAANYNQTKVDAAWSTFSAATCGTALPLATTDLYCCFTLLSKMNELVGLKSACARSTSNPSRYCGAELNALTALSCPATNSADCGAMPNCQWYGAFNKCLYNPASAAALDAVCTPCNRNLFKQFATGGMTGLTQYSTIAAAFDFACRKVEDQYCLLVAKDMGYRAVGELQPSDVTSMCSGASFVAKRCYRSMTASAARAIVRSPRASFEVCGGADECQTTLVQSLTLATALEKAAATMCSVDATGTNCLLKVAGTNAQMPCLGKVGISGNCTDCDTEASAAAAATGCCGPVIATSGALIATAAPTGRLLFSNIAQGGAANVNFMASTPPALDSTNLNLFLGLARTQASANLFAGVQACPTFYSSYSDWVSASNIATCTVRPNSRTYDFVIAASYAAYNSCSNKTVVADSLNADLSIAIGITRAQIMSSAITDNGDNSLRVRVRFSDDSSSMITAIDAAIKASSFTVYFLTAGRDMVYNCPAMIPDGTVANMLVSATPVANEGDEPVPTTTTTTRTTTTMTTTTTVAAPGGVASLSTVAAATIAALVGAVMLF